MNPDDLPRLRLSASDRLRTRHEPPPPGLLPNGLSPRLLSHQRANIAAMNNNPIAAGLWALAAFDPALVHLAELTEHFRHLPEEDPIRTAIDRLTSVYVEGQCSELLRSIGITTQQADLLIDQRIGDTTQTIYHLTACTNDPLALEIFGYALYLGSLTNHSRAPWNRYSMVMEDCYHQLHPRAKTGTPA